MINDVFNLGRFIKKTSLISWAGWALLSWLSICNNTIAQTSEKKSDTTNQNQKISKNANSKAAHPTKPKHSDIPADNQAADNIDWGDWLLPTNQQFGVGIQGNIEAQMNVLDQSNLLDNATGVATTNKDDNNHKDKKQKARDLKQMMAELEAMEAKVKKEIDDDTEF